MNLLKKIVLAAAGATLIASCSNSGLGNQGALTKSVGDAAVDSVTKNVDPVTKTAITNATGYGTNPIEEKASGLLKFLGR